MVSRAAAERYIAKVVESAEDLARNMNVPAEEVTLSVHVQVFDRASGSWPQKGAED